MSGSIDHQPRSNNSTGTRTSTWRDERQNITSFANLSLESQGEFLSTIGYLFGVRMDFNTGPKRAPSQVASLRTGRHARFHEATELDTETIVTKRERGANYARRGWSLSSLELDSPWIKWRIAKRRQPNASEESITKRVLRCQLQIDVPLEDLSPTAQFDAEVRDALGMATNFEKFQALYAVFDRWGDVIPLAFDVGTSLTVTELKSHYDANPVHLSNIQPSQLIDRSTARFLVQGTDVNTLSTGDRSWVYESQTPIGRWSQIRITRAVPVTALLSTEIQAQISQLHSSLITYYPFALSGSTNNHTFDGISHALKTIRSITVYHPSSITNLRITYSDGSSSQQGYVPRSGDSSSTFDLNDGEHIFEVHIWEDVKYDGVSSIQFFTTAGRISHAYGGSSGTPTVLREVGGILAAFAGKTNNLSIHQLQGIWRHDVQQAEPRRERNYSPYYGYCGTRSEKFDDLPLLSNPNTTISKVKVRSGQSGINAIQLTYAYQQGNRSIIIEGPRHGKDTGDESLFELAHEEYIVSVRGRTEPGLMQLCFVTNQGRTSPAFGGTRGSEFTCQAPLTQDGNAMRLHSISGRYFDRVDGLAFAWARV